MRSQVMWWYEEEDDRMMEKFFRCLSLLIKFFPKKREWKYYSIGVTSGSKFHILKSIQTLTYSYTQLTLSFNVIIIVMLKWKTLRNEAAVNNLDNTTHQRYTDHNILTISHTIREIHGKDGDERWRWRKTLAILIIDTDLHTPRRERRKKLSIHFSLLCNTLKM